MVAALQADGIADLQAVDPRSVLGAQVIHQDDPVFLHDHRVAPRTTRVRDLDAAAARVATEHEFTGGRHGDDRAAGEAVQRKQPEGAQRRRLLEAITGDGDAARLASVYMGLG